MDKLRAAAGLFTLLGLMLAGAAANAATTLNVTPTSVAPGGASVTATWSGIPTPSGSDWLGLYTPGAGNSSYISYRYTNGAASGSLPFSIPGSVAPGTYQLRLLANGGYTVLATSNNFSITATVSGTVTVGGSPLAGVAFAAPNGGSCTNSNASGQYTCTVPGNWSGSVTPSLAGYVFTPASRSYSNVTANQTAQNYTAAVSYQVSGTVTLGGSPLAGVALAATNGVTCTNSNASGQYSCTVLSGWSGSVTPSLSGHSFTPASRNYSNVTAHQTAQDYAAVVFQVSGTVTASGSPLAGVAFAATNGGSCTTSNASGQYSCTVVTGWSGSVTPTLIGYTFAPPARSYSNVTADQTAQDYTATPGGAAATISYIHPDHLNTPRLITNDAGQVVWRWDQADPFGGDVPNENPSGLGSFTCNLRLPGQYFDKETNLHYNYFRDYDPAIGRYIQSDPIGIDGGINTYAYVDSNPLRNIDPYGLQAVLPPGGGAAGGGAAGAAGGGILGGAAGSTGNVGSSSAIATGLQKLVNKLFCPPECEQLQAEIAELAGELRVRYVQMTADVNSLYCTRPVGQFSWMGHQLQYNQKQKRLQKLIAQAKAQNCPVSPEDERLANTPPPPCPAR